MSVKMKMKMENQSHGHKNKVDMDTKIVNGHKNSKFKQCLGIIMQHLLSTY